VWWYGIGIWMIVVVVYEAAPGNHMGDLFLAYHVTEISVMLYM
jgi:hypothetical protein